MGVNPGAPSWDAARAVHAEAFVAARASSDVEGMAAAALQLASLQRFGGPGGRTPALLHEAYLAAADTPPTRARLAAALARSWVYSGDAFRAAPFAVEAVEVAEGVGDPTLLADALDAQLATSWGPEDLSERLHITARLQDVAAHVDDERTRMDAHLWRLTTALETLDVVGVHRQLSALDLLADETDSPLVRYFAMTRRSMHATVVDDLDLARSLAEDSYALGVEIGVADAFAVYHERLSEIGRHADDREFLTVEAPLAEEFGVRHGMQSVVAQAAVLWLDAGDVDRAGRLALQLVGGGFHVVPYDVDWMLIVTKVTEAASAAGLVDVANEGLKLLSPYAGRAVVNAGAVDFAGVVEDYLWRAGSLTGDPRAEEWRAAAMAAYRRIGAPWWQRRVKPSESGRAAAAAQKHAAQPRVFDLRPVPGGVGWSVGPTAVARVVPDLKGLHYLRALLQRPGIDMTALTLSAMVAGHHVEVHQHGTGEALDRRALAEYRQRLRDIDEELDDAQSWSDTARVERLELEREALLRELAGATGLHGQPRTAGGSAERARVAVRKAIAAAIERIETDDPATARLLRTSVRTGSVCRYDPDPDAPVTWQLD